MKTNNETVEAVEMAAAAKRIAAANEKRSLAEMDALAAKVMRRKAGEAVGHLAAVLGACFIGAVAIAELRFLSNDPAALLDFMSETGLLGYDENLCHYTLAMG